MNISSETLARQGFVCILGFGWLFLVETLRCGTFRQADKNETKLLKPAGIAVEILTWFGVILAPFTFLFLSGRYVFSVYPIAAGSLIFLELSSAFLAWALFSVCSESNCEGATPI